MEAEEAVEYAGEIEADATEEHAVEHGPQYVPKIARTWDELRPTPRRSVKSIWT